MLSRVVRRSRYDIHCRYIRLLTASLPDGVGTAYCSAVVELLLDVSMCFCIPPSHRRCAILLSRDHTRDSKRVSNWSTWAASAARVYAILLIPHEADILDRRYTGNIQGQMKPTRMECYILKQHKIQQARLRFRVKKVYASRTE